LCGSVFLLLLESLQQKIDLAYLLLASFLFIAEVLGKEKKRKAIKKNLK
jgi:hypothetical protein